MLHCKFWGASENSFWGEAFHKGYPKLGYMRGRHLYGNSDS